MNNNTYENTNNVLPTIQFVLHFQFRLCDTHVSKHKQTSSRLKKNDDDDDKMLEMHGSSLLSIILFIKSFL